MVKPKLYVIPLLCLFWNPASAQQVQCFPYDKFIDRLQSIGERMTGAGVDANGNLVQVLVSEKGGWTFIVRLERAGTVYACPLSGGEGWQRRAPKRGQKS